MMDMQPWMLELAELSTWTASDVQSAALRLSDIRPPLEQVQIQQIVTVAAEEGRALNIDLVDAVDGILRRL